MTTGAGLLPRDDAAAALHEPRFQHTHTPQSDLSGLAARTVGRVLFVAASCRGNGPPGARHARANSVNEVRGGLRFITPPEVSGD